MNRWFIYLKMEIRKGMGLIPFFVVSALIAGAAIFAAAAVFCAVTDRKQLFPRAEVAVVMDSDGSDDTSSEKGKADLKTTMAIGLVESMSSVKSLCDFTYMSPSDAAEGLRKGTLSAAIYLPKGTYENINSGVNTPVLFRLSPSDAAFSGSLFRQLVTDGVSMLKTVEAGIYAIDYQSAVNPPVQTLANAEDTLFGTFLKSILSRTSAFEEEGVSLFGAMSMTQFYVLSGLLLLLLLLGIGCASFYSEGERAALKYLRRYSLHPVFMSAAKWIALTLMFFVMTMICTMAASAIEAVSSGADGKAAVLISAGHWPMLLGVAFSIAAYVHLIYTFASSRQSAFIYLLTTAAIFSLAGGFLPVYYLPRSVRVLLPFIPVRMWQSALAEVLYPSLASDAAGMLQPALPVVLLCGVVLLIPAWIKELSEK